MRLLLSLMLMLIPSAAMALSCLSPNIGRSLNDAAERGDARMVVAGVLLPPEGPVKRKGFATVTVSYRLVGAQLLPGRQDRHFARNINLESSCVLDQWCGPLPDEPIEGVFLLQREDGVAPLLRVGPCPGAIFVRYDLDDIDTIRQCLTDGRCSEAGLRSLDYHWK